MKTTCVFPKTPYRVLGSHELIEKGDLFNRRNPVSKHHDIWMAVYSTVGKTINKGFEEDGGEEQWIVIRPL